MHFLFTVSSWLSVSSLLVTAISSAVAQTNPTAGKASGYVEKMPQLPSGGNTTAILQAVQQRFVYPAAALRDKVEGRVFVKITVGANGLVQRADIVRGLRADCDSAIVMAVRQLPRFEPANRGGQQAVASTFTLPITLVAR